MSMFNKVRQMLGLKPVYVLHKVPESERLPDDYKDFDEDEFNDDFFDENDDFDDELDPFSEIYIEAEDEHEYELYWDEDEEDDENGEDEENYYLKDLEENDLYEFESDDSNLFKKLLDG